MLKNERTGEIRLTENLEWVDETTEYMWTEGVYSSDGNRHLFFEWSKGNDPDRVQESTYLAICAYLDDGTIKELDDL